MQNHNNSTIDIQLNFLTIHTINRKVVTKKECKLKIYTALGLLFLTSCARPLVCPLFWPFGFLPIDNPFRWFLLIVFAAVIIYLIVNASKKKSSTDEKPLSILKKRYAKGEISREEYKKMKKELEE